MSPSTKQWLEAKQAGRGLTLYELTAHERVGNGPVMADRARMDALPAEMGYIR